MGIGFKLKSADKKAILIEGRHPDNELCNYFGAISFLHMNETASPLLCLISVFIGHRYHLLIAVLSMCICMCVCGYEYRS